MLKYEERKSKEKRSNARVMPRPLRLRDSETNLVRRSSSGYEGCPPLNT